MGWCWDETDKLTISSGSSGRRVALPEPSFFSMLCLINRILSILEINIRVEMFRGVSTGVM